MNKILLLTVLLLSNLGCSSDEQNENLHYYQGTGSLSALGTGENFGYEFLVEIKNERDGEEISLKILKNVFNSGEEQKIQESTLTKNGSVYSERGNQGSKIKWGGTAKISGAPNKWTSWSLDRVVKGVTPKDLIQEMNIRFTELGIEVTGSYRSIEGVTFSKLDAQLLKVKRSDFLDYKKKMKIYVKDPSS